MTDAPGAAPVRAVLFDLDGTFADTAPDMARAINRVRAAEGLAPIAEATARPHVSSGARGMLWAGYGLKPGDGRYEELREAFLAAYAQDLAGGSRWFDGMADLVAALEARDIAWGIVTNKAGRFAAPLLDALAITPRAGCAVFGDTCARAKPHPDPLLHAAALLRVPPAECLYVGDDERDILAANAAGMRGVAAMYGYLGEGRPPREWAAYAWIAAPRELLAHCGGR